MKISIYNRISINVILIFLFAMLYSFLPEMAPKFFGDWFCVGRHFVVDKYYGCDFANMHQEHNSTWH